MRKNTKACNSRRHKTQLCATALLGSLILLGGCASSDKGIRDRSGDYVREKAAPPLKIPEHLNPGPVDMSPVASSDASTARLPDDQSLRPDVWILRDDGTGYQSFVTPDGQHRLRVVKPPADLWKQLLVFWQKKGVPVAINREDLGVMVTDWIKAGTLFKSPEKFRLRLYPEPCGKECDIVLQQLFPSKTPRQQMAAIKQQTRATNRHILHEILTHLAQYKDEGIAWPAVPASPPTPAPPPPARTIRLEQDSSGAPMLTINQGFAPAWRAVEQGLEKAGIAVVDKDRSAGLFFTRLNLPEKRAKNSRRRTARQQTQRVHVETQGSTTRVRLEKAANTPLDARVSAVILKHLKRYMN